ncbi:hypothetical protein BJ508DRAFT_195197, partial [Ascobolus immersus RN42]
LHDCHGSDSPMAENGRLEKAPEGFEQDEDNVKVYQQMLGCAMYAMTCTRPDLAFSMSHLSQFSSNPTWEHLKALKRVYQYLQRTKNWVLKFRGPGANEDAEQYRLHAYCDADWGGDKMERRSTSGYCVFLGGACAVWASRRQASTAASSTEAEWMSSALATQELLWIRHLLLELEEPWPTTPLYNDNQGACIIARNPEHRNKLKHIDIAYNITRKRCCGPLGTHELDMIKIDTAVNTADVLTKPLGR